MFKRLVSNLPFSPALIGQVGIYADHLKKDEVIRRTGLIVTTLAVAMQSIALVFPPTPANISSSSDIISGGFSSVDDIQNAYRNNQKGFKDILTYAKISEEDLDTLSGKSVVNSLEGLKDNNPWIIWRRLTTLAPNPEEQVVDVAGSRMYLHTLTKFDKTDWSKKTGSSYDVFEGTSKMTGRFAIIASSGNLLVKSQSMPSIPISNSGDQHLTGIKYSNRAVNLTQGEYDATATTAMTGDRIQYTLSAENNGKSPAVITFRDNLSDVIEYSSLLDLGGGTFSKPSAMLEWPTTTIKPGGKETRSYVVAVPASIPSTPRGLSNPSSYDCVMENTFGETTSIAVGCGVSKLVERSVSALPRIGTNVSIAFSSITLLIVFFLWARSKQLSYEIKLIRRDFSNNSLL